MKYAVLLLLAACASAPARPPTLTLSWPVGAYPIELRVSAAMDACQTASVASAVTWLETRVGADLFTPITVNVTDPAVLGIPVPDVVSLAPALALGKSNHVGETWRSFHGHTTLIHYANIEVVGCSPWVVTHELAHALGLGHVDDPGSLMYYQALNGWKLSEREIAEIRKAQL